jgi:hypothetical protein
VRSAFLTADPAAGFVLTPRHMLPLICPACRAVDDSVRCVVTVLRCGNFNTVPPSVEEGL